jgi:hypothetical protein
MARLESSSLPGISDGSHALWSSRQDSFLGGHIRVCAHMCTTDHPYPRYSLANHLKEGGLSASQLVLIRINVQAETLPNFKKKIYSQWDFPW